MSTLAYTGLKRQRHVSGLRTRGSLSRGDASRTRAPTIAGSASIGTSSGVGAQIELNPAEPRDALELMCVGQVVPNTELRIADDARAALPDGTCGPHLDSRRQRHARLFRRSGGHRARPSTPTAGSTPAISASCTRAALYIAGRSKEIIFVNGQNYYPYDLENIAQRAPGLDLNKVVAAGVAKPGSQGEELVVFVLHRGSMAGVPAHRRGGQPPHQRAHRTRGRAGHPDQAHSEDHQRQGAAASVGSRPTSTASSTRNSRNSRRCARRTAARRT